MLAGFYLRRQIPVTHGKELSWPGGSMECTVSYNAAEKLKGMGEKKERNREQRRGIKI